MRALGTFETLWGSEKALASTYTWTPQFILVDIRNETHSFRERNGRFWKHQVSGSTDVEPKANFGRQLKRNHLVSGAEGDSRRARSASLARVCSEINGFEGGSPGTFGISGSTQGFVEAMGSIYMDPRIDFGRQCATDVCQNVALGSM